MSSKDIKPWHERVKIFTKPPHVSLNFWERTAMLEEITDLRQALEAAEKQVAALSFIQGKGLTDCDMHDDESN